METVKFEDRTALEDWMIRQDFNDIQRDIVESGGGSNFLRDILKTIRNYGTS